MIRRSQEEWKALIQAQKDSGLNQKQFCKEHRLNPEYFSSRKKHFLRSLRSDNEVVPFVRLDRAPRNEMPSGGQATVRFQGVELDLPSTSAPFLAELLKCLA